MSLSQERKENDAASPHIHCWRLVSVIKQGFGWHVPFRTDTVLDLYVLLKSDNFLDLLVILEFQGSSRLTINRDFAEAEVDQ